MKALSAEHSICEGNKDVKELFEFVMTHAGKMTASQTIATSHAWDAYWESHMQQERRRLYAETLDAVGIAESDREPVPEKPSGCNV